MLCIGESDYFRYNQNLTEQTSNLDQNNELNKKNEIKMMSNEEENWGNWNFEIYTYIFKLICCCKKK
jgi:hypothetical protein